MDAFHPLKGLAAREVRGAVSRLLELTRGSSPTPLVTLSLTSGNLVSGTLLDMESGSVLLAVTTTQGECDLVYVDVARVEAVTVHKAIALATHLDADRDNKALEASPTSKLTLQRRVKEIEGETKKMMGTDLTFLVDVDAFTAVPHGLNVMAILLDDVFTALKVMSADTMAKGEVRERVAKVELRFGSPRSCEVKARVLVITIPPPGTGVRYQDAQELHKAIEACL